MQSSNEVTPWAGGRRARAVRRALSALIYSFAATGIARADVPPKPSAPPAGSSTSQPAPDPAAPAGFPAAAGAPLADALTGAAKAAYDSARLLYRAGDFAGALLQFDRAYDLSSDPRLLWNIAVCEKNLRRYARAVKALERYQAEGATRLSEEDRRDAAYLINAVRPFVATLTIHVSEPGADIFIDGERVGTSPVAAPLLIDMGARRVQVSKKGFIDYIKTEQVYGEAAITLRIPLVREVHQGRLVIVAGKDDVIRLDGKIVGQGTWNGVASSGGHTLRVTAPGMKPYQTEVTVQDNSVRRIAVSLEPEPRTGLPAWMLITGTALLAVGAGFGIGYLGIKASEPTDPPPGNLAPFVVKLQ
ncbi:MAG TPA: PEGA domain-containing protein [Polyangiaceae bacterium]|jgi:hypothetical protein|nr:PEGA domain-containing protein [Polyangiaceae bacterium]